MINWRYNPFTKVFNPTSLTEYHVVEYMDDCNMYGFQLYEAPQRIATLGLSMTVTQYITGGATWTEVSRNTAPNAGQYRVDYDADTFFGTGRVNFNAADVGKVFSVSYQGLGTIVSEGNISRLAVGYFARIAVFDIATSTSWTVPASVTRAYVKVIGGGGGGARSAGVGVGAAGGGGGVSEKLCTVSPGDSISVVVAAGGAGQTSGSPATAGGSSSFGAYLSATGGSAATTLAGSAGGVGSGGDLNYSLGDGGGNSGTGGGPGGYGSFSATNAQDGNKYGGGGGGSDSTGNGGSGASGLVVIYY